MLRERESKDSFHGMLGVKPDYSFRKIRGSQPFGVRNVMTVGGGWYVGLPAHPTGHGNCL